MNDKLTVGVVFGGRSGEHEVSLMSANSVISALDRDRYGILPIGITKKGEWYIGEEIEGEFSTEDFFKTKNRFPVYFGDPETGGAIVEKQDTLETIPIDVIFPVLHGTFGEDGTVQGLFELSNIPYAGSGILGSANGMDKEFMKKLFIHNGIRTPDFRVIKDRNMDPEFIHSKINPPGYPLFVKPANLGSSVGVEKVDKPGELMEALKQAFEYDNKVIVEKGIDGREIECSVLGGEDPEVSRPGEILPDGEFYDYEAKYESEDSKLIIPAQLTKEVEKKIKTLAKKAFLAVGAYGFSRVDFLFDESESRVYVNEINTIPGFTEISMFPKLWEASGLSYSRLIDEIIELAIQRNEKNSRLKRDYSGELSSENNED